MDAIRVEILPATTKTLLNAKVPETTDISKEKDDDILYVDEIDEDDEIRLRFSDDEEIEQDNTLEHVDSENQQASLQLKNNDLEFDVHVAVTPKETSKLSCKDSIVKQNSSTSDICTLNQTKILINSSLSDKIINQIDKNINEKDSIMSESEKVPPLMQNSPKYWTNNLDKRWTGVNSPRGRQNFSHRNSDWCKQQYTDKNKFNNKNNFNNHSNYFNRLRSNARESYSNQSRENCKEIKKEEIDESQKINKLNSDDTSAANNSIEENNICDEILSKENNPCIRNDQSFNENNKSFEKEIKNIETDSKQKENNYFSTEKNSSADVKHKENKIIDNESIIQGKENKSNKEEVTNTTNNSDSAVEVTKDCDDTMIDFEKEKSESESKKIIQEDKSNEESSSNNNESKLNEDSVNSETSSEVKINISESTSSKENESENLMEIDENDEKSCNKKDNTNDQNDTSGNVRRFDKEINENNDKSVSENNQIEKDDKCIIESEKESNSKNKCSDQKSNDVDGTNEHANQLLENNESTTDNEMEISETEINDNKNSPAIANKISEIMDIETDTESSNSLSIAVAEVKSPNLLSLKPLINKDEKTSSEVSSLALSENNYNEEKKESINIISEEYKEAKKCQESKKNKEEENCSAAATNEQQKVTTVIEEVDLVDDEPEVEVNADNSKTKVDAENNTSVLNEDKSQKVPISNPNTNKIDESNEEGCTVLHKKRRRKRDDDVIYQDVSASELQLENGVRQKRRSARNAEEMIRKEILKNDEEDDESSDESSKLVPVNYRKSNLQSQPLSPPSLKRTLDELDCITESVTLKRIKSSAEVMSITKEKKASPPPRSKESIAEMKDMVRKISQEDIRGKLKKLTQEELEALLLQKIVECITIRGEMGKLREQARASKRNQEATRAKCQQLQKQVEGFDMVLKRITYDKNSNGDKYVPPIKINRSVGLQVNFLSQDNGIHNLKQIQTMKTVSANGSTSPVVAAAPKVTTTTTSTVNTITDNRALTQSPRKMLKTRSPRRPEVPTPAVVQTNNLSTTTNATPTALVMNKAIDSNSKRTVTLPNSNNVVQLISGQQQQQQTVIVNSTVGGPPNRPTALSIQRINNSTPNKASDLIDLTDEEDKSKSPVVTPITTAITTRFPRVLQAVPASVAITNSNNLRLVQAGNQVSQTAIVNNSGRLTYVMQSGVSGMPTRQLVLANSNTIRPVTSVPTRNISTINYKQAVPTLPNGTVRVLTAQASAGNTQVMRHPAPLPETPATESNPTWKLPPPAPSLKISKVTTGIVLSWNMTLSDKYAEIVSYQLYAYQEVAGTSPSAALWKKVGDVRALPLPMACTLTQFTEGNNYYFAVRAVDIHSRFGLYSKPGNISL